MSSVDGSEVAYTLQPGDYLPTFLLSTTTSETDPTIMYNDSTIFDIYYVQQENGVETKYAAINCTDYINGPFWDDYSEVER